MNKRFFISRTLFPALALVVICASQGYCAQASSTVTTDWDSEEVVETHIFGTRIAWHQTVEYVAPLGSIKGHCCAVCNEGNACDDCRGAHSARCSRYRDLGAHYLEIGYDTVARFADSASKSLSSEYGIEVDLVVAGAPVSTSGSGTEESSESQSSSVVLDAKTIIPIGTSDHVPPATCWKVNASSNLRVTLFLVKTVTFGRFGGKRTKYRIRLPAVVAIDVKNDGTIETSCPCSDGPTSKAPEEQRSVVPENQIKPVVSDAPAFGMAVDSLKIHPNVATIEIRAASPAFGESTDMLFVTADEEKTPFAGGEATASAKRDADEDKPLVTITPDMIVRGLSGLILAGARGDDGTTTVHYVTFDRSTDTPPTGAETIHSLTASDGGPTTLQSFQGATANVAVETGPLPAGARVAVGNAGAEGEDARVAGTLDTGIIATQLNARGGFLLQTHYGRFTGRGLGALLPDGALIGLVDDRGQWIEGTQRPLADAMRAPEGTPLGGPFSPALKLDRREIGQHEEYTASADKRQLDQMAKAMRTTVESLLQSGVTRLFVEGEEVDSSPWSSGQPASYTGRAPKGATKINVSATYDFLKNAAAADAVRASYERLAGRTQSSLDSIAPNLREKLESNVASGRDQALNRVQP